MANLPTLCVICPAADIHNAGLMDCLMLACFRALFHGSSSGLFFMALLHGSASWFCLFVVGDRRLRYGAV